MLDMKKNYKILLGFLLIFIFSVIFYFVQRAYYAFNNLANMKEPTVNSMNFPDSSDDMTLPTKDFVTVFPMVKSNVYFEAKGINSFETIDSQEFASFLENQEKAIGKNKFIVVIKSSKNAKYRDMVDLLDKLSALSIKRYMIVEITKEEENKISQYRN